MKFGVFHQAPEADGQTHGQRYAEMFEHIALAEELGFDVAWLAELHFGGLAAARALHDAPPEMTARISISSSGRSRLTASAFSTREEPEASTSFFT